ncbi:MAG: Gfo/Idh/MocA family oxidoreductase [Anaerolineales bacterium]|nr:Gfo/Idh/MocA family oxidoreductase [Anaerolineales bacterium]
MKKIRWGLLSTANINKAVIPAIRQSPRGELVAVASRTAESAASYAAKWEIPQSFGSYAAMLDSGQVDAVYIGLPNHLHAEWSIKAMQAGVHVLCEKPFAISLAEVDAMIAVSRETGRVLAEAFMYRHHPQTRIAGELVRSGRLGEVTVVRGVFNFTMSEKDRQAGDVNVRLVTEYGGGSLWDVGVYPLSYAQYIYGGPPQWVFGSQWVSEFNVDETFCGQMGYPGGGMAQISSAFRSPYHTHIEVIGTQGRLVSTRPFVGLENEDRLLTFYDHNGQAEEIPVPEEYLYLGEVEDLQAAVLDGAENYLSLAETRDHVRTVLALYQSAQSGQPVELK